jgi:hypothetical protein
MGATTTTTDGWFLKTSEVQMTRPRQKASCFFVCVRAV